MNWTRLLVAGAALALAVLIVVQLAGEPNRLPGPEPSGEEPQITVVVDPQTGATRRMALEEYVKGVVGGEMGRLPSAGAAGEEEDWPEEAYAAQAILARTFILAWLERHPGQPVSGDVTESQAYRPDNVTPIIERAVERTRGQVIRHQGELVQAWFHSYAGGVTATAKEGLNFQGEEPGYVRSVELPENPFVPDDLREWQMRVPLSAVQAKLAEAGIDVGTIRDIRIDELGPSDRITAVTVVGSSGTKRIHGADFRLHIGPEVMKSTRVDPDSFRVADGHLVASGTGFGHGVGLSQWDAFKMAREGKGPEEIVKAFFKDIEIVKAWE